MKRNLIVIFLFISGLAYSQSICITNLEKEIVNLINQKRVELGYSNCVISETLMFAANTNCKEIINETYISHKPSEFGDYNGEFAQIRYGTSETNPTKIFNSLTFRSTYTDYSDIILSEDQYSEKDWKGIGICIRQNMIVIFFGDQKSLDSEIQICEQETFFDFDPASQYPSLHVTFPADAIMKIYTVDKNGIEKEYNSNTLSNFINKGTNLNLPLNEKDIAEYKFYIVPQLPPVVPQEPIFFSIKNSEKGIVSKTIQFNGNSMAEIEAFLKAGNDINAIDKDFNNYTMLHRAVLLDLPEIVEFLISNGCDVNALSEANENAIFLAKSNEVFDILLKAGSNLKFETSDQTDLLYSMAVEGLLESVKFLVEVKGFDINHRARKGDNALNAAVFNNNYEVAKYLLDKGAQQVMGWLVYPIHDAVDNGNLEMVRLLVDYGANVNSQTSNGQTPLAIANNKFDKNQEIINFLTNQGAK
jgi:ankyrin repeat protein